MLATTTCANAAVITVVEIIIIDVATAIILVPRKLVVTLVTLVMLVMLVVLLFVVTG